MDQCQFIIRVLSKLHIKWERLKSHENISKKDEKMEENHLINMADLQDNINLIVRNKEKMLKQFDHNDFETLCGELSNIIDDTKRWVQLIENLTN